MVPLNGIYHFSSPRLVWGNFIGNLLFWTLQCINFELSLSLWTKQAHWSRGQLLHHWLPACELRNICRVQAILISGRFRSREPSLCTQTFHSPWPGLWTQQGGYAVGSSQQWWETLWAQLTLLTSNLFAVGQSSFPWRPEQDGRKRIYVQLGTWGSSK